MSYLKKTAAVKLFLGDSHAFSSLDHILDTDMHRENESRCDKRDSFRETLNYQS